MFRYRTDAENIIIDLNEAFTLFARENWRSDFEPEDLLGQSLIAAISDPSTRHLYSVLLERLKKNRRPVTLPFRCDSPSVKRFMELTITPSANNCVDWSSRIIREERREPIDLLDKSPNRSKQLLTVCSWCKRCIAPEWLAEAVDGPAPGTWLETEEMMGILGNLGGNNLPALTHTACPDCFERVMAEIEGK